MTNTLPRLKVILPLIVLVSFTLSFVGVAEAQKKNDQSRQAISIAPFLKEVKVFPDKSSESFTLSVSNDSSTSQEISLSALNFGSLDETGGIAFAGNEASGLMRKYGLADWLKLEKNKITLGPNKTAQIRATIINNQGLSPGGHYGAVIASVNSQSRGSDAQVSINQKISSLIFATKLGGERYDLSLKNIAHNGGLWNGPDQVEVQFFNPGNTHVTPRGIVKLMKGDTVISQGVINQESGFILPETNRQYAVKLTQLKPLPKNLLNSYKIVVDYRYDGLDKFASKNYSVRWYSKIIIPITLVLAALVIILTCFIKKDPKKLNKILRSLKLKG